MKPLRQDTARTRRNLLGAASEIFAEKGFRDATIAEISERAGTNIAAVNYHFGNKETLYKQAWLQSFRDSIAVHPPDGGVGADAPPAERLKAQVASLLRRITDENNREFVIVHKELASPTGLLEEVMREEMRPLRRRIMGLVREILGPGTPEIEVRFCTVSIISQCVIPMHINMVDKALSEGDEDSLKIDDIEGYAEHVIAFSLAGMGAMAGGAKAAVRTRTDRTAGAGTRV